MGNHLGQQNKYEKYQQFLDDIDKNLEELKKWKLLDIEEEDPFSLKYFPTKQQYKKQ